MQKSVVLDKELFFLFVFAWILFSYNYSARDDHRLQWIFIFSSLYSYILIEVHVGKVELRIKNIIYRYEISSESCSVFF